MRSQRAIDRALGPESPFSARCPMIDTDDGSIDHLQACRGRIAFRHGLQPALGPALELLVDRVPIAVSSGMSRHCAPVRAIHKMR